MISEFEQRLANVLGDRLLDPFNDRVFVPPGPPSDGEPFILIGVQRIERVEPDIGSHRPEVVPGSDDHRRVLRLQCTVNLEVRPGTDGGRSQLLLGLDTALYALDAADLRNGSALSDTGDPGFLIQAMQLLDAVVPSDPSAPDAAAMGLTLKAEGWFWPVGIEGEAGVQIGEIRVRDITFPIEIAPAEPGAVAGGAPIELSIRLQTNGLMRLDGQSTPLPPLPFGPVALTLAGLGGGPGAGTLSGGTAGAEGVQFADVTEGVATITYTPPAEAGTDELIVALDNGAGGIGIEIGRFLLQVEEA